MAAFLPPLVMLQHGLRACRHRDADALRIGWWTLRASRHVRHQLKAVGPAAMILPALPSVEPDAGRRCERVVHALLDWRHSTCLERALVSQAWAEALGRPIDVVIGVSAPAEGFTAHAWLEGEPVDPRYVELWRLPPQARAPDERHG